jgi:hypothetical protein
VTGIDERIRYIGSARHAATAFRICKAHFLCHAADSFPVPLTGYALVLFSHGLDVLGKPASALQHAAGALTASGIMLVVDIDDARHTPGVSTVAPCVSALAETYAGIRLHTIIPCRSGQIIEIRPIEHS